MWNFVSNALNHSPFGGSPAPGPEDIWGAGGGRASGPFQKYYEAYSAAFIMRDDIEVGNKILLPPSALNVLARQEVAWPMLFELANTRKDLHTHSGVLEFSAGENKCYLPHWLMQNLEINEGELIRVTNVGLPKGTFVKLQPLTSDFLDLSNHRAVLENTLRYYACLTVGDCIRIDHNDKIYQVRILETKPGNAISVIETDLEVDFEKPIDYEEPEQVSSSPPTAQAQQASPSKAQSEGSSPTSEQFQLFAGDGQRLDGRNAPSPTHQTSGGDNAAETFQKKSAAVEPWLNVIPGGVHRENETYSRRKGMISRSHIFKGAGIRLDEM